MKALVLGATGRFGSETARLLVSGSVFEKVFISSRKYQSASQLAAKLGVKATPVVVDTDDKKSIEEAVKKADVVVNVCSNPVQTVLPVVLECSKQRKHYCDVTAEADALLPVLEYESELEKSGVSMLFGCGIHPGVTDLFGMVAANELETVHSVDMYILSTLRDYSEPEKILSLVDSGWEGGGGMNTIIFSNGVETVSMEAGKIVRGPQGSLQTEIITPDGFAVRMNHWATAEPLSIGRRLPEAACARAHWGVWPSTGQDTMINNSPLVVAGKVSAAIPIRQMYQEALADNRPLPKIHYWATAEGERSGKRCSATVYSNQNWASNREVLATTCRTIAYASEQLAKGAIYNPGFGMFAEVFDPMETFEVLSYPSALEIRTHVDYL